MEENSKILSIITVVKNNKNNLEETIKSIIPQKTPGIEYIIIDGKSDDGTNEVIEKYKYKIDKVISEEDYGIYDAMNKGILNSSGKIIGFCNSGDTIYPGGLDIVINNFKNKDIDVLFATVKRNYIGKTIVKTGFNEKRIFYNFDFATSHSTGFYVKKKVHNEIGLYDLNFKISSDYDFYFRMIKKKKYKISSSEKDKIVGEMKSGGHSSKFPFIKHLNEEVRIRRKNKQNFILIIFIYINSLLKNFKKIF